MLATFSSTSFVVPSSILTCINANKGNHNHACCFVRLVRLGECVKLEGEYLSWQVRKQQSVVRVHNEELCNWTCRKILRFVNEGEWESRRAARLGENKLAYRKTEENNPLGRHRPAWEDILMCVLFNDASNNWDCVAQIARISE